MVMEFARALITDNALSSDGSCEDPNQAQVTPRTADIQSTDNEDLYLYFCDVLINLCEVQAEKTRHIQVYPMGNESINAARERALDCKHELKTGVQTGVDENTGVQYTYQECASCGDVLPESIQMLSISGSQASTERVAAAPFSFDSPKKLLREIKEDSKSKWVLAVSFSPDGKVLAASGYDDGTVRLWDSQTGNQLPSFQGYQGIQLVHAVCYSPDGTMLASASNDKTIRLKI
eukprot:g68711.t1